MITIKEISNKTDISQRTIRRHIHAGLLKYTQNGTSYLIKEDDFELWYKNLKINKKKINSSTLFNVDHKNKPNEFLEIDIQKEFKIDYWDKPQKNGIKFADFFSGSGGLTTGFIQAGFKPVYSIEIMPQAVETYNYNIGEKFNDKILDTRDITNILIKQEAIKKLKNNNVDLIIGGFPCQGFSMAGNRVVNDPRNSLYIHMLEIIKAVSPKIVVMENVTGLRSMLNGKVEKKIIKNFQDAGYKISIKVLNSADYEVPQQRKRVIFIANKIGKVNLYPMPIIKNSNNYKTVQNAISDLMEINENATINHQFTKHSKEMKVKIKKLKEGQSLYKGFSDAWKRPFWDKPSPTVKENHGGVLIHPKKNRVMTPKELARLQSFPDDFKFTGSKKWQLVQIGNAVPPLMAKAIALSIKKMIKD